MVSDNLSTYLEWMDKKGSYKYFCLFGAGDAADKYWYQFVKDRGFRIDFFCDNDKSKWGKAVINDITCISPDELLKYGKDVLCMVSTSPLYTETIAAQLKGMGLETVELDQHWLNISSITAYYLNITMPGHVYPDSSMGEYNREVGEREKIAVYTCIVDGYDDLKQPKIIDRQCDYFCLSFERPEELGIYKWIDITDLFQDKMLDHVRINRFCKLHPHLFFQDYKYSIYCDGSFEIIRSIAGSVKKVGRIGIGLYEAGGYGNLDIYGEAAMLMLSQRTSGDSSETILKQVAGYAEEGFPRNFGEAINNVIVREHNNPDCIAVMETWWNEIKKGSRRDQLSFWYAVWKNGHLPQDVGRLGQSSRLGTEYKIHDHKKNIYKDNFK